MLISQIGRQINRDYGIYITPQELNLMLIKTGDLVDTAIGKVETRQGKLRGISGELRQTDGGKPFWRPDYDDFAQEYVIALALEVFAQRGTEEKIPFADFEIEYVEEKVAKEEPRANHNVAPEASCNNCMLFINEECLMPKDKPCSDYRGAYIPTEAEIEAMQHAAEESLTNRMRDQNALGGAVER